MAPRMLPEPFHTLEDQIIETLLADEMGYPTSYSDMQLCVRNLMRMFDVKRRPVAIELPKEPPHE